MQLYLKCLTFSIFFVAFVHLTIGTYFEHYESIVNALVVGEFTSQIDNTLFTPVWFMVMPLFSALTQWTESTNVYSLFMSFFSTVILSALLYSIILLLNKRVSQRLRILFLIIFVLLYVDCIIHIYNQRISFCSILAAFLLFIALKENNQPWYMYMLVVFLSLLGLLARLEIAVLTSGIVMIAGFLFQKRSFIIVSSFYFVICLATFSVYKVYQTRHYYRNALILQAEQEFEDRFSVSPSSYSDLNSQLIVNAMSRYIQDDEVFGTDEYLNLVCNQSFTDYLGSSRFWEAYNRKLFGIWDDLVDYRWLIGFTALNLLLILISGIQPLSYVNMNPFKTAFMLAVIIVVPLAINLHSTTPYSFTVSLLILVNLGGLWLYVISGSNKVMAVLALLLVASSIGILMHLNTIKNREEVKYQKAKSVRDMLAELNQLNKSIVMMNGTHFDFYPSKLYSDLYSKKIQHHYVDFFLGSYNFISQHSKDFFGGDYTSLKRKILTIANNDNVVVVDISNGQSDSQEFYAKYMGHFYQMNLVFTEIANLKSTTESVKGYYLHTMELK